MLIVSGVGATAGWAMLVGLYIELDMRSGSAGLMVAMRIIDFVVDDMLSMDKWAGDDWGNFDKDSDRYAETTQLLGTAGMIAAAVVVVIYMPTPEALGIALSSVGAASAATALGYYGTAQMAINAAMLAHDIVGYSKEKSALDKKAEEDTQKLLNRISNLYRGKMLEAMKDAEEYDVGSEEMLASYMYDISNSPTEVMDPSAIAMSGYSYHKQNVTLSFGFEDVLDYTAGTDAYKRGILYG